MWEILNSLLVNAAEFYVDSSASIFTWGEVEVPECLKSMDDTEKEK